MELLDSLARRYGSRPSAMLGEACEYKALSIDLAAHNWGIAREQLEAQKLKWKMEGRPRG